MKLEIKSIRSFVGAKDFDTSRSFYRDLGLEEKPITEDLSLFQQDEFGFYLQRYYVEDWVNNTVLFIVVSDIKKCFEQIKQLEPDKKYPGVKIKPIKKDTWGEECFIIDPSGVLLHFAQFY